jgi:hypothetical protein
MKVSDYTALQLGEYIAGDKPGWPYRKGPEIVDFFNKYGFRDVYGEGFGTRRIFAQERVAELNGKPALRKLFKDMLDPRLWTSKGMDTFPQAPQDLNELLKYDGFEVVPDGHFFKVKELSGALIDTDASLEDIDELSDSAIAEQLVKCRDKISAEDYTGAITNARCLVETVCTELEMRFSPAPVSYDGDMVKLFNRVRKLLNLDPSRQDISDALKQVLSGLSNIVNGLATIRNKMSDAHVTTYRPNRHHAKLAVNAAQTLVDFLIETANYQRSRGLI